uniref:Uncharacterized protein n=2 Tax=Chrysotila carterae TaxID=13221 RepID=A0A6S9UNI8_CHRCT
MLSQSETELSLPFTHMASALDRLKQLHLKHVQAEHVSGLSALLAFNAGMASALKEVLSNRDAALIQYQRASSALDSRTLERQKFQASAADAPDAALRLRRAGASARWQLRRVARTSLHDNEQSASVVTVLPSFQPPQHKSYFSLHSPPSCTVRPCIFGSSDHFSFQGSS